MKATYKQTQGNNLAATAVDFAAATYPIVKEIDIASQSYVLPVPLKPTLGETILQFAARLQTLINEQLQAYFNADSPNNVSTCTVSGSVVGLNVEFVFSTFEAYNKVATGSISSTGNFPQASVRIEYEEALGSTKYVEFYIVELFPDVYNSNTTIVGAQPTYTTSIQTRNSN